MSWTASLPFKGRFFSKPISSMNHWKPSMIYLSILLPCTDAPIRLFCSAHLFTPLLVDLERILEATDLLQAAKSVRNCALVSNGYGLHFPTNVTDTDIQSEQRILKCSNFHNYLSEQGGISSALNQGNGTDSYRITTYTGDKKNASGCKSSGLSLKRRNSTLCDTSCTCCVKFTLQIDHNSIFSTLAILLIIPTR